MDGNGPTTAQKGKTMARRSTQQDVQRLYDALMEANAAEPYSHSNYAAIEARLKAANASYYGTHLADRARDTQLDCGEVWSRQQLTDYEVAEWRSVLQMHVESLTWATEYAYIEHLVAEIGVATDKILELDRKADVGAWIDAEATRQLREKATSRLRPTNAQIAAAEKAAREELAWEGDLRALGLFR